MWGACCAGTTTSLEEGIFQGFCCPQKSRSKGRGATVVGRNRNLSTTSREDLSSCFYKKPKPGAVGGEELGLAGPAGTELGRGYSQAAESEMASLRSHWNCWVGSGMGKVTAAPDCPHCWSLSCHPGDG